MRKEAMWERRARWRRIFEEAGRSRLSVRQFCKQRSVNEAQFYYWRRVLCDEDRDGAVDPEARFVLVRPEARPPEETAAAELELVVERGWRLRIPPAADEATLRRVLSALRAQA